MKHHPLQIKDLKRKARKARGSQAAGWLIRFVPIKQARGFMMTGYLVDNGRRGKPSPS
jgi:hypothetical protein